MSLLDKLATLKTIMAVVSKIVDVIVHCVEYVIQVAEK